MAGDSCSLRVSSFYISVLSSSFPNIFFLIFPTAADGVFFSFVGAQEYIARNTCPAYMKKAEVSICVVSPVFFRLFL